MFSLPAGGNASERLQTPEGWKVLDQEHPLDPYVVRDVVRGVDLMKAGTLNPQYPERVGQFNWYDFYERFRNALPAIRDLLRVHYDYVLIDSRTGFTDVSGLCTMVLPEKLVAVFTPNQQSLSGVLDLTTRALEYRRNSDDPRPFAVFPLPSRIEDSEHALKRFWRAEYQRGFEETFRVAYGVEDCDLAGYFDEVQVPYKGYFAYGEKVAVIEERSEALSLRRSYETFYHRLIDLDFAWDAPEPTNKLPATRVAVATKWTFDVYIHYSHWDRSEVLEVATLLRAYGIKVFIDAWSITPGSNVVRARETALAASRTAAYFVGPKGHGDFQQDEFLFAMNLPSVTVIPVLLPGADLNQLPLFLARLHCVVFRSWPDEEAMRNLLWGITGQYFERLPSPESGQRPGCPGEGGNGDRDGLRERDGGWDWDHDRGGDRHRSGDGPGAAVGTLQVAGARPRGASWCS